tara:strand:- start:8689 stop:9408 length:720 start_codon:yes stop_codon:yes gene_type:complete
MNGVSAAAIAQAVKDSRATRKGKGGLYGMRQTAIANRGLPDIKALDGKSANIALSNSSGGVGRGMGGLGGILTSKELRVQAFRDANAQAIAEDEAKEAARQETLRGAYATNNTDYKRAKRREAADLEAPEIGSDVYTRDYLDAAGNPEVEYKGPQFGDFGGSGKAIVGEEEEEVLKVDVKPPTDKKPSGKREKRFGEFGVSPTEKTNKKLKEKAAAKNDMGASSGPKSGGLFGMRGWGK